ncbi:mRNA decay protein [Malassezia yamatoensis]|uniref:mRNA decay protein n=1 Tax=Malassezia yamatoensis TaxID=253288 RepID=A0AAJ5Z2N5_9BASI|nr:mRNA decay protein [Malassezia yamatoensis]
MTKHQESSTASIEHPMSTASDGVVKAGQDALSRDRDRVRVELFLQNAQIWIDQPKNSSSSLDASLKRNSTFIKRLRQGNVAEVKDQLLRDIDTLHLAKYIEEVVPSVVDLLAKSSTVKDRLAAVELTSALHRRFPVEEFAIPLTRMLATQLSPATSASLNQVSAEQREKDEAARLTRQRILIRAACELGITALLGTEQMQGQSQDQVQAMALDHLYGILRNLDREHTNVPLVIQVLKSFGSYLIAPMPLHEAGDTDQPRSQDTTSSCNALVTQNMQTRLRKLIETYYLTLVRRIEKARTRLQDQHERNRDAYIRSGEVFEDRQHRFERHTQEVDRQFDAAKFIADALAVKMPDVASATSKPTSKVGVNLEAKSVIAEMGAKIEMELASDQSPWEDEETRSFYTDLVDLATQVPLYWHSHAEDSESKHSVAPESPDSVRSSAGVLTGTGNRSNSETLSQSVSANANDTQDDLEAGAIPTQVHSVLVRLPTLASRQMIDEAAKEIVPVLHTRATRNRLVRHLLNAPKERRDLLPYYARLIATLHPYVVEVSQGVLSGLDAEFRQLQRRRASDSTHIQLRLRNAVFLGELTKFAIVGEHQIFFLIRTLLEDFSTGSLEVLALFLETCGRFLVRTPATTERMHAMLEQMQRKRSAHHTDARIALALENAYYQCLPPPRLAIARKQASEMQQFITYLFGELLAKHTVDRVVQLVRRLDWDQEDVQSALFARFTQPWEVKFHLVHLLAQVMRALYPMHTDFFVPVLDSLCEMIDGCFEQNALQANQRRVALMHYLGELYNYRVVNSHVVFYALYRVCLEQATESSTDYFQITLVCTLLDSCGACFDQGAARRRLDEFLLVFRAYIASKAQPLPSDVVFRVKSTLQTLRPKMVWPTNMTGDLYREVSEVIQIQQRKKLASVAAASSMEPTHTSCSEQDTESSDSSDESDASDSQPANASPPRPRRGSLQESTEQLPTESTEDMELHERELQEASERDAELALDQELAQLMSENPSSTASSTNASNAVPITLPHNTLFNRAEEQAPENHMMFSLLTRRGNRPQTQAVPVPASAAMSVHIRQQLDEEAKERQQLKAYVLAYGDREAMDSSSL